ncbi:MAG: IgA Peptidase M64 [Ignavibacteria bacterium]|nr:IgA Peptidase M64 [Ignavibacteria bacterium]
MKKAFLFLLFAVLTLSAQTKFDKFFYDKTFRLDYDHAGDIKGDEFFLTEFIEEPYWGGPHGNLIEPFNYGKFKFEIKDYASGEIIYSRNYATLFSEWQTTEEAKHYRKSFPESVIFPYPKEKFYITFYSRNKENILTKKCEYLVDPNSYFVKKERRLVFPNFKVHYSGEPARKVDIVIIPEGYTKEQMGKFKADCSKFAGYLFNASPYKENKDKFNIWGIEAPSADSGTDIPGLNIWKQTVVNTGFYTFDIERYCMTTDYRSVRDVAANAPYDQIYILVNTEKYGGGAIYNFYSICVSDNKRNEYIFTHEFGHGFASLADEYYESSTAYQDFYSKSVEPTDPNVTTLVDFASKWKDLVADGTPIPTPVDTSKKDVIGAYEGGGYVAKGVYRPRQDCTMKSISIDNFCPVCKRAIQKMIDFYTQQ